MKALPLGWLACLCLCEPSFGLNMRQALRSDVGVSLMQSKVVVKTTKGASNVTLVEEHPANASTAAAAAAPKAAGGLINMAKAPQQSVFAFKLGKEKMELVVISASFLVAGVALLLAFFSVALLVCAAYDLGAHWFHWARFRSCEAKVKRAHEAFHSKSGDLALCPYCVESLSMKRGPSKVVFLCGHRFHVQCSNKWFSENPLSSTHCPICRDVDPFSGPCQPCLPGAEEAEAAAGATKATEEASAVDGAFGFILQNLHRMHPAIVSEDSVARWMKNNTEIWLSELKCPRYNSRLSSIFNWLLGVTQRRTKA
eukprot:TRINITY_DN121093_c0_g1_i1.p1 TRINITY_DN121093_c0_g1~~TRINITY_DN121093_c0_g1_i1.p1  ORF type:complete len:312 (+),score=91.94 TRINITY_DN121093_c0_g1_i1:140-1075(+)